MIDIKTLMFDKSLSQRQMAEIIETTQSEVSNFATGRRRLLRKHIDNLIAFFGEETINSYTKPDKPIVGIPSEATVTILSPETVEEIRKDVREEIEAEEIKKTIVLTADIIRNPDINIKQELKAGHLDEYAKPTQDTLPNHTAKVYAYCDDMEPEIRAGEPMLVQLQPSGTAITPGLMYFIDLPSGGIVRYIEKEEDGKLYLKARNSNYGDIVVNREDVQSLSIVRLILRTPRSMSNKESTLAEMINRKDGHLSDLLASNNRLIDEVCKQNKRTDDLVNKILNN
jgi:transcriptional regulator with XRE-family HTH domain